MSISSAVKVQVFSGSSPYVVVEGEKMDRAMLKRAIVAVEGKGDGRIAKVDVPALLRKSAKDGNIEGYTGVRNYTQAEKNTMAFLRASSVFTPAADALVRHAIAANASRMGAQTLLIS